jgi:transglutaminase-like putative cysteine protease
MQKTGWSMMGLLLGMNTLFAQADLDYKKWSLQYPGESLVILQNSENLTIKSGKMKLSMQLETNTERLILNNSSGNSSQYSLDYTAMDSISNIEAFALIPDGKKYKKIKVKEFKTTNQMSRRVFYDGAKTISFFYPGMKDGAKTQLNYTTDIQEPHLLPSYYFQAYVPVIETAYTVNVSNDVEIGWRLFNVKDSAITFSKEIHGDMTTYSWKMKNVPPFITEGASPSLQSAMPHIIVWIKTVNKKGVSEPVLRNPGDLYDWYYKNVSLTDSPPGDELKAVVDSLMQGAGSELDKVQRVYSWVQHNIKYIAFEDGMGGFVPRSAKSVCEKKFGDCKDMANIIHSMLTYAGITSYLTWVGTRSIPYTYEELPTPSVDNHMITTYIDHGNYYYLDATGQFTPYYMPSGFIQGKEVLIGKGKKDFEIRTVPVMDASKNLITDSIHIRLGDGKLYGQGLTRFHGYTHIDFADRLSYSEKPEKQVLREYLLRGCNKIILDSFKLSEIANPYKDGTLLYYFNIDDYAKVNGDEVYVNMNMDRSFLGEYIKKDRKRAIEREFKNTDKEVVTLKIPPGYELEYMPRNTAFRNELFGFEQHYSKTSAGLVMDFSMYCNTLLIEPSMFPEWNKEMKELQKAFAEVVILKKIH